MGSIGGGGRYADLTDMFGLKNMSGVGVSFGAERIFDVMEELNLFPETTADRTQVLFIALDEESHFSAFETVYKLRQAGINAELYPAAVKMKKQMKYANARQVPFVAIVGENERNNGTVALKTMATGEQVTLDWDALLAALQ